MAAERNGRPVFEVLRQELRAAKRLLEIGSGTGQHAVFVGAQLRHLTWQTSDLEDNHAAILTSLESASLPNVLAPIALDVRTAMLPAKIYDAIFSSNTAHIMSYAAVRRMFELVADALKGGGLFCLYGPFREQGGFNAPSNAAFDKALRNQDPAMGLRPLEDLDGLARSGGLSRLRRYAMPANNLLVVWQKR